MAASKHTEPKLRETAPQVARPAIAEAIEDVRRSGTALHKMAREAGVSPAAVIDIRNGKFRPKSDEKEKKTAGRAQTLTRLTLYINHWLRANGRDALKLEAVLADFAIDATKPEIGRTIANVQGQAGEHRHISDPVLRQIALRHNVVNVGVLKWSPFFDETDESAATSWAGEYSRRLLGSINPTNWTLGRIEAIQDFDNAVSALGSGSSQFDAIFGVYDTPNKRLKGLRFLHLPGIAMPLSFVCVNGSVTWDKIITPDDRFMKDMQALVLKEEVGDLFLLGPCQYPKEKLERMELSKIKDLVSLFFSFVKRRPGAPIFFCADRTMCRNFYDAAKRFPTTDKTELKIVELLHLSPTNLLAPKYQLGIAVRADADAWLDLLKYSQENELFQNALEQTARCYAKLLSKSVADPQGGLAASADIELTTLPPQIPRHVAERFAKQCMYHLDDVAKTVYADTIKVWTDSQARTGG